MSVVVEIKDVWRRIKAADMGTRTVALMVCTWLLALFFCISHQRGRTYP